MMETEQLILHENDWLPNNERLPVLLYRGVVKAKGGRRREIEVRARDAALSPSST